MTSRLSAALACALFLLGTAPLHAADPAAPLDFNLYMRGKDVYERNCIVCHGVRGDGKGELSPTLVPKPRSFREGMFKFRSTPFGKLPTDDDLRRTIRGGLSGTAMGMFTQITDEELDSVVTYVKSFSRQWRKAGNHAAPMVLPSPPPWFADPAALKARAQAGRQHFTQQCAACHGSEADGKGPAALALQDIWGLPAIPSDLRQPHLRCGGSPDDLFRLLTTGMNGTPMASFEAVLTAQQRWEIVAYLLSIRQPSGPVLGE